MTGGCRITSSGQNNLGECSETLSELGEKIQKKFFPPQPEISTSNILNKNLWKFLIVEGKKLKN